MSNQSFKDFLSMKDVLLKASEGPRVSSITYTIDNYTKFPVVEEGKRVEINVKPKQVIRVKWLLEDDENPIVLRLSINDTPVTTNFSGKKLLNWLERNAR